MADAWSLGVIREKLVVVKCAHQTVAIGVALSAASIAFPLTLPCLAVIGLVFIAWVKNTGIGIFTCWDKYITD